jgi:hypothetical protein
MIPPPGGLGGVVLYVVVDNGPMVLTVGGAYLRACDESDLCFHAGITE